MPSFGRIDEQKCKATEPSRARTSLPILPNNALQEGQFRGLGVLRQLEVTTITDLSGLVDSPSLRVGDNPLSCRLRIVEPRL
jgi:hypothetical protein